MAYFRGVSPPTFWLSSPLGAYSNTGACVKTMQAVHSPSTACAIGMCAYRPCMSHMQSVFFNAHTHLHVMCTYTPFLHVHSQGLQTFACGNEPPRLCRDSTTNRHLGPTLVCSCTCTHQAPD
jgi:hypothetical protein